MSRDVARRLGKRPGAAAQRCGGAEAGPPGAAVAAVVVILTVAATAAAMPPGSDAAAEALAACERGAELSGDERSAELARGLALAEAAVRADGRDARAHFAIVCNLGKKMETRGVGIAQLVGLYRLRRELDAALELAPSDADVLTAKGALLLRLPRLFGGDPAEAEVLLRRALAAEPGNGTARCYLAAALTARGAAAEAGALDPHC